MRSLKTSEVAENFIREIQQSHIYADLYNACLELSKESDVELADLEEKIINGLKTLGFDRKLRNGIFLSLQQGSINKLGLSDDVSNLSEPIVYIKKAQMLWEKRIMKSLNSMSGELKLPLAQKRGEKEQKDMLSKWTELSLCCPDLNVIRPVYAPKDFLEVVVSLQNSNVATPTNISGFPGIGLIQVPLKVKDVHALRLQYFEMTIGQCQSGIDDQGEGVPEVFDKDRTALANKAIKRDHVPVAQIFSRQGCPVSVRSELWRQMLNVVVEPQDRIYYEQLKAQVLQHNLLTDLLLYKDVKLTASNDDQYFVFEDLLYQILLPFSRDTSITNLFSKSSASPPTAYIYNHSESEKCCVTYPPNGLIPFHGFAMFASPLAYLYDDVVEMYCVFKKFYMLHLHRLHSVSSHPQGIVSLCLLFESLLLSQEPDLVIYLYNIGCYPLKIAFKWIMRAFSGYLSTDQVLLLWDRILAYSSLEILSVLAVAIFSFRKKNLLKVVTVQAAEAVLADLTTLQVIPLIQLILFSK